MGDNQPILGSFQSYEKEKHSRIPAVAGVLVVLAAIGIMVFLGRASRNPATEDAALAPPDPRASELSISDFKMSTADNFAGASVTYLEGKIENKGARNLTGITVQVGFKDQVGQLIQKETMPLAVITAREPYVDTSPLSAAPLKPGQIREFRLAFEHVSESWNRVYPEVRITKVVDQ